MTDEIINWDNVFLQSETFQKNKPFQYTFVKNFLNKEFYDVLYSSYPEDDDSWIIPKDFGRSAKKRWFGEADPNSDKCSLDVEDSSLNESWNKFFHYIHSKEFLQNMSRFSNFEINKLKHFAFIKNGKGSFNMPHTHHPTEKKEDYGYNLTLLVYFAKGWKKGDPGGTYLASEEDEESIIFEPYDLDNSCVIFAESSHSWHGSRYMTQDAIRRSIQFTLI